jgi:hypothetical protein
MHISDYNRKKINYKFPDKNAEFFLPLNSGIFLDLKFIKISENDF